MTVLSEKDIETFVTCWSSKDGRPKELRESVDVVNLRAVVKDLYDYGQNLSETASSGAKRQKGRFLCARLKEAFGVLLKDSSPAQDGGDGGSRDVTLPSQSENSGVTASRPPTSSPSTLNAEKERLGSEGDSNSLSLQRDGTEMASGVSLCLYCGVRHDGKCKPKEVVIQGKMHTVSRGGRKAKEVQR